MADVKITALPAATSVVPNTDVLPLVTGGGAVTSKATPDQVVNSVLTNSPTLVTPILGTPQSGNFSTGTFTWPTFNQDTTGSAASSTVSLALKSTSTTGVMQIVGPGAATTRIKTVRNADDTLVEVGGSYTPTGTWDWTSAAVTWPTFNQNTSGSAGSVVGSATITSGTIDNTAIGGTTRSTTASTTELVGPSASANFTRFPNALAVVSNVAAGIQQNEGHNIGIMAEGVANASDTNVYGVGVYGAGYTNGATRSGGVVGEGHVSATGDTGASIGVRGYANQTHAGGANIGLYGNASGGSANYSLYMSAGDIYGGAAQTWYLNGNLTFSGAYVVTAPVIKTTVYSAAGTPLPSATTAGMGARAFVSDATDPAFGAAYASGGSNKVPVFSDGSSWYVG